MNHNALLARIGELEQALWAAPAEPSRLEAYQAAYRDLEAAIAAAGDDQRHHFIIVIPVADSPQHLQTCLTSLLQQCQAYGYGGSADGRFRKVSVLLADDSAEPANIARNREIAHDSESRGLTVEYFGLDEQRALLASLDGIDLRGIVGDHPYDAFSHKGQAMMRNIAYLKLASMQAQRPRDRLLFYTIDADQSFAVNVVTTDGGVDLRALNYFYHLDRLFDDGGIQVLTGKVVGDPPVSPAVMAANFLDDAIAFISSLRDASADADYQQPSLDTRGSGEAAYHDMADMFGFGHVGSVYRYRCRNSAQPSNREAFEEFASHLNRFFHGEHPTRITWYRHAPLDDSVQPARTVYTGNYVFTADALGHFIPFAPLRLRMSGPTMGRVLRAWVGKAFVSANVPMLHRRTLDATGAAEYRPGVVDHAAQVDMADEFERQFHGDVMLFSIERLSALGFPRDALTEQQIAATLDTVRMEMYERYAARREQILARATHLRTLVVGGDPWWSALAAARAFAHFVDNIERNFGSHSAAAQRIDDTQRSAHWRGRQLAAIATLRSDRGAWRSALVRLRDRTVA
ncbi:MAG: hypothetical protein KDJ27_00115 [Gammaproteobacteria bacterium]|nr:hypothetical protein [Gammaproteobacteria bacterium]